MIEKSNVSKIRFSKGEGKLWQLIPAKPNVNNSFYIVSEEGLALDLNQGYATLKAEIISYEFHKMSNQIWVLRKNEISININQVGQIKF